MATLQPEHRIRPVPVYVKLLVGLVFLLGFLLVSEFVFNAIEVEPAFKNQFFPLNRDIDFADIYQKDARLFWRFRENQTIDSRAFCYIDYHINSSGRRGPETQRQKSGLRIVALGNSCTFGWGVPWAQTWTAQLEPLVKEQYGNTVEIINAGVPGYSSHQGRIYFEEELVHLDPDVVLICFGWNDHWAAGLGIPDCDQQMPAPWLLKGHNLLAPLKTYQFMRMLVLSLTDKKQNLTLGSVATRRVSQDQFYMNLRSMVRLAHSRAITPILVVPPIAAMDIYFDETVSPFHRIHASYQQAIHDLAHRENLAVADLQQVFDQRNDLFDDAYGDAVHYNSQGHAVAAQTIVEVLRPVYSSK
ncbi:MAG: SGNH/GDSL hydrolase family protein [candidate division Zixibacteria bacterium]|nr:SGNH/GDSL hydrolase family protein [candidate division Zixibacteria bacterium]